MTIKYIAKTQSFNIISCSSMGMFLASGEGKFFIVRHYHIHCKTYGILPVASPNHCDDQDTSHISNAS